jgi:ComF family protein
VKFVSNIISPIRNLLARVADLVVPRRCPGCGAITEGDFCGACADAIRPVAAPICETCGADLPPGATSNRPDCEWCRPKKFRFDAARAAVQHDGPTRRAVIRFKYHRIPSLGGPLAALMTRALDRAPELFEDLRGADVIVPVPLHWRRLAWRGFNQADQLARPVAAALGIPVAPSLKRIRNNRPQSRLTNKQRVENVKGIFALDPRFPVDGKKVILLDDVMTTGSTVNECARVLKKSGAKKVYVFTMSRRGV